ncbi:hypothetical protein E4U55_001310 [Claviceps digitariae]|nr:hypothetical protein E4U55_001310 [Claviceps digitariae]
MEIYQQNEAFIEKDGDLEFGFTKIILRGPNHEYFYAITKERLGAHSPVDLEKLDKIPIPTENVWPSYSSHLLRAPEPLPQNSYVKKPSLLHFGDTPASLHLSSRILHEIEVCELLRKHPHPNVAHYLGCVVSVDRITGLCFPEYKMTLFERISLNMPFDKDLCLRGIADGIRHLHSLGIVHNDINPANIMVDEKDRPVIIDFDCCQQAGEKLRSAGTWGWSIEEAEYALFENDFFGLSKIQEYIHAS